jgi:hypothetical protein
VAPPAPILLTAAWSHDGAERYRRPAYFFNRHPRHPRPDLPLSTLRPRGVLLPRGRSRTGPGALVQPGLRADGIPPKVLGGPHPQPPTYQGTPATLPALHRRWQPNHDGSQCDKRPRGAFFPGAAPEPGWRWRQQPGPWGRWPTRRCPGEEHLTTDLPENASRAAGVTSDGEMGRPERPRGLAEAQTS